MNEELIRQYTQEAYRAAYGRDNPPYNVLGKFAKALLELHHARAVAPLVEAAMEARRIAMEQTVAARIPECGKFGEIAQHLDAALAPFLQEGNQ